MHLQHLAVMEPREAAAGPRRQLPPIPTKARSKAACKCAVDATCDAEALVTVVEPAVCWEKCNAPAWPQLGGIPMPLCSNVGLQNVHQAENAAPVQPLHQAQLRHGQQHQLMQPVQAPDNRPQCHLADVLAPATRGTSHCASKQQQSSSDVGWQPLLPGALYDTGNAASGAQGSKSSNEAQLTAEGSSTFQFSMCRSSNSSPDLTLCACGSCYTRSHEHSQQQEQSVRCCSQQATDCRSCSSRSLFASVGRGGSAAPQGSPAGACRSRLGQATGSELPDPPVPGPARLTYSCAGGGTIKNREESWHHCHDGAANWALERGTTSCSLLSGDGLGRRLRIHIATFNMAGKVPPTLPPGLLGQPQQGQEQEPIDLYVFATQESGNISEWEQLLAASLPCDGSFERLAWQTLRAIHLVLFASHRFRRQVLGIRGSAVATGIGNLVGNKGAVALSVQVMDYKLLFISSHFAAHDDKVEKRNADFHRIKAGLFSSSSSTSSLAEVGVATGSHPTQSSTPALGNTLQQEAGPVDSNSSRGTSSHHGTRRSGTVDREDHSTCRSRRATGSRARSSLHTGWTSGLWHAAGQYEASSQRPCSTGLPQCPSNESEFACMAGQSDADCRDIYQLRAASCPPEPEGVYQWHQGAEQLTLKQVAPPSRSEAGTPRSTPPEPTMRRRCADCASPSECSSAGRNRGVHRSGLSIAEELRNQLSFFKSLVVSKPSSGLLGSRSLGTEGATADHDVVFWVGDLNYRINGNSRSVGYLLRSRLHEVLHANDQLRLQQKKGKVFQGYQEGKIHFYPTFKFLQGTSKYSEQRVPSWTDRILWKVRVPEPLADELAPTVQQTYYTSVPEVVSSDHKPVVAGFEILLTAAEVPCVDADKRSMNSRCSIM